MIKSTDITKGLKTRIFGEKIFAFDSIDSTNTCARLLAECGIAEGTVVYAEGQTDGRGRLKRTWLSDKGKNLLFSIVFAPTIKERKYYLVPLLVSTSIVGAIKKILPEHQVSVKWPNDILLDSGKKICGILTELTYTIEGELRIIAGIGLNVNQTDFPPHLSEIASSLIMVSNRPVDRFALLREILHDIDVSYELLYTNPEEIITIWRSSCTMFDKPVLVRQGETTQEGLCKDIDSEGALLIEDKKGTIVRIIAGDVTSVAINTQ
jgi:BirA family transcriptional regulator, biotin operon repressor / biotin---[acetyl-CoA-carboxylase] ligase